MSSQSLRSPEASRKKGRAGGRGEERASGRGAVGHRQSRKCLPSRQAICRRHLRAHPSRGPSTAPFVPPTRGSRPGPCCAAAGLT